MKFKRGKVVGFKVGVYGTAVGSTKKHPSSNACVFATHKEAQRAGVEMLSRWMGPDDFRVVEQTKEAPNYVFPLGDARPRAMSDNERAGVASAVINHLVALARLKELRTAQHLTTPNPLIDEAIETTGA